MGIFGKDDAAKSSARLSSKRRRNPNKENRSVPKHLLSLYIGFLVLLLFSIWSVYQQSSNVVVGDCSPSSMLAGRLWDFQHGQTSSSSSNNSNNIDSGGNNNDNEQSPKNPPTGGSSNANANAASNDASLSSVVVPSNTVAEEAQEWHATFPPPPPLSTSDDPRFLDFYILGFPKCGTTALMHLFKTKLTETEIVYENPNQEEYPLWNKNTIRMLLKTIGEERVKNPQVKKYGVKWPTGLSDAAYFSNSVSNLIDLNPKHKDTRFIIGMRHPVKFFESFYNYRMRYGPVCPHISKLIGPISVECRGIYSELALFEKHIMALGKFELAPNDLKWLAKNNKTVVSSPNKVFLYLQEQLADSNMTRRQETLNHLVSFVGGHEKVTPKDLPKSNSLAYIRKTIHICDDEYADVRNHLIRGGKVTSKWFETHLDNAKDVYVANKEHFLSLIKKWGRDPCKQEYQG